jgi:hypothetical protein
VELFRRDQPVRNARLRVPDVAAGNYLVATFDGSEGGAHYTWDYFRVDAAPRPRKENRDAYDLIFWLTIAGGGGLFATALILLLRRHL